VDEVTVDEQAEAQPADEAADARVGALAAGVIAAVALIWLGATLATAHASVLGNSDDPDIALGAMAFALPNVIAAALLAGAGAGLGTTGLAVTERLPLAANLRRLVVGAVTGLVVGGICLGLVVYTYGDTGVITRLGITIAAAGLLGGAAAGLPRPVLTAGLVATVGVLLVGLVAGFAQPGLVGLFGGGKTLDSEVSAGWFAAYLVAIVGGVLAGLLAFRVLRRYGPRVWLWYLLAGMVAGVLLLATEGLTRVGGATLLNDVRGLSEGDRYTVDFTAFSRLRNGMVVFFIGGLTAMIAVGRTLRPAATELDAPEPQPEPDPDTVDQDF
jgi:hypothetical protein